MYLQGKGCKKDEERAYEMYKRSADLGNIKAQYNMGIKKRQRERTRGKENNETRKKKEYYYLLIIIIVVR